MTVTVPTQVPSQITVPDWLVTAGKAYLVYVGIVGVLGMAFFVFVAYQVFKGLRRTSHPFR